MQFRAPDFVETSLAVSPESLQCSEFVLSREVPPENAVMGRLVVVDSDVASFQSKLLEEIDMIPG